MICEKVLMDFLFLEAKINALHSYVLLLDLWLIKILSLFRLSFLWDWSRL